MTEQNRKPCPMCRKMPKDNSYLPFCSSRCKLLDLGNWAMEEYRIPAEKVDPNVNMERDEEERDDL